MAGLPGSRLTSAEGSGRPQIGPAFAAWYNLCRKHESLGGDTPAMAAGMTGKVWTIRELLERAAEQ